MAPDVFTGYAVPIYRSSLTNSTGTGTGYGWNYPSPASYMSRAERELRRELAALCERVRKFGEELRHAAAVRACLALGADWTPSPAPRPRPAPVRPARRPVLARPPGGWLARARARRPRSRRNRRAVPA